MNKTTSTKGDILRAVMAPLLATGAFDFMSPPKTYTRKEPREQIRRPNQVPPKIAVQARAMYEKWERDCFPSTVNKPEPDPNSISSIKQRFGVPRAVARKIKAGEITI